MATTACLISSSLGHLLRCDSVSVESAESRAAWEALRLEPTDFVRGRCFGGGQGYSFR